MSNFNQSKYINNYIKENYDTIKIQLSKGKKEIVKAQYKKQGFKSMNEYINHLIDRDMKES